MRNLAFSLISLAPWLGLGISSSAHALDQAGTLKLIEEIDDRQRNSGDYTSEVVIEEWEKKDAGKDFELTKAFQAQVYRRDEDDKLIILFTAPKSEAGKGYLRVDNTLLLYEPSLGKWERQTDRASIGGTGSRRNDFDESRLACEYKAKYVGEEKLGKFAVHHLKLEVYTADEIKQKKVNPDADCKEVYKDGVIDVGAPILELWVDKASNNLMKREEFSGSGKVMRRALYPSWRKMFSKSKGADVYVPEQMYLYDLLGKELMTKVQIGKVSLDPVAKNLFTKAWIEARSR